MHAVSGALSLPSRGAFHLSLAVLCTIGHPLVFSLGGWSPRLRTGFHVSRPTLRWAPALQIATGLSPASAWLSIQVRSPICLLNAVPQPRINPVWALPLSLTTTKGISVDLFSSGYLDVSVPRVGLLGPMYSARGYACAWVSPFGIAVVNDPLRLAPHFRGLARPSSPADA